MTKGKIEFWVFGGGFFTITNAGGAGSVATSYFLEAHRKWFKSVRVSEATTAHALEGERLAGFIAYAASKGFEVVSGGLAKVA